jgi:hypothetical protein
VKEMYTVKVYEEDTVIESETFNTLTEAFKYADKYSLECYTEINNVPYYPEA